ncbi:MAG: MBL fold metallo-hydrolase [Clostridia bacterium]|nr:MBL fold metallo-hydrolase [Clostridia bacterium]
MLEEVKLFCHSSIKLCGSKTIYIDPYNIEEESHDADFILCTHTHYDHYSPEDIEKIKKKSTVIIAPADIEGIIKVVPNVQYEIEGLKFKTTYAYNKDKDFHPKTNNWVGYIVELDGKNYYIAGDTDNVPELQDIKCDVAFVPIGGTYTMNKEEAVVLCKSIEAKIFVPTHYGLIVGEKTDGVDFKSMLKNKQVEVLI